MPAHKRVDVGIGLRVCNRCKRTKPIHAYYRNTEAPLGHMTECKVCMNERKAAWKIANPERAAHYRRNSYDRWRADLSKVAKHNTANKLRESKYTGNHRNRYLKKTYGITQDQYEAMYLAQDGRCAICAGQYPVLSVDHDHATTRIRKLLCHWCNAGLGSFQDNAEILAKASEYLRSQTQLQNPRATQDIRSDDEGREADPSCNACGGIQPETGQEGDRCLV